MLGAADILSWGRVDPYYVWSEASGFAGRPETGTAWLPLLVEAMSTSAESLRSTLEAKFADAFFCPAGFENATCFTLYVRYAASADLLQRLAKEDARWEIGLPFLQAAPSHPAAVNRQRAEGDVVGFIDYGCAFAHPKVRAHDTQGLTLRTRVLGLWDQAGSTANRDPAIDADYEPPAWKVPEDLGYGVEWQKGTYTADPGWGIDKFMGQFVRHGAIDEANCYAYSGHAALRAPATHGTFMMDLATGHPSALASVTGTGQPEHDIVFVHLPRLHINGQEATWLLRTHVLDAVRYIFNSAGDKSAVTINLSYGGYAGPHDGQSILELALDQAIESRERQAPTRIVIAAGNGADQQIHAQVTVPKYGQASLAWTHRPNTPTDQFMEVWFPPGMGKDCDIQAAPPGRPLNDAEWTPAGSARDVVVDDEAVAMVIAPTLVGQSPDRRMVLLAVSPTTGGGGRVAAPSGEWTIGIRNRSGADVAVDAWIERNDPVFGSTADSRQSRFSSGQTTYDTMNSVAHGKKTLVVGGYVTEGAGVPEYSGRGRRRPDSPPGDGTRNRPDWLAACEESKARPFIEGANVVGSGLQLRGTSVAAAIATRYVAGQASTKPLKAPSPAGLAEWRLPRV